MTDLLDTQETPSLTGAGLLGLVTTGMYGDPLSMYREYIQNAADAAAGNVLPERARVSIALDVTGRRIRIRDNGPGLSPEEALERLLPIGRSDKRLGTDRGFRGIGRLAALAFAKTVSFTTRAGLGQSVTRVTWHSDRLPDQTASESELERAILDCVEVATLPESDFPEHFFDVDVTGVARHSAELLLNRDAVRKYVGEVCPVPLSADFPFAEEVAGLFDGASAPLTLEVILEGDPAPVVRPYGKSIWLSADREVDYTGFEVVRIRSVDDSGEAAIGWVAHSSYMGAIPKAQRVRGIRARVGNIQVGGEAVFDDLFTEERFNRWCVGELHVLDSRIVPNSRRDYFQPGPHLRNLENQLTPVLSGIRTRCRQESTSRNRARKTLVSLCNIEDLYALATSGYLSVEDSTGLVREAVQEIKELRRGTGEGNLENGILESLDDVEDQLNGFALDKVPQPYRGMAPSEMVVYQRVFGVLAAIESSPGSARELIHRVFTETSGEWEAGPGISTDYGTGSQSQARPALEDTGTGTSR